MNKKINPIIKHNIDNNGKINPIMDFKDRNEFQYIITKKDKEHIRGDNLFININGYNIYADIDDAILINTHNKMVYIYHNEEMSPSEEREYLILLVYSSNNDIEYTYQGIIGRQESFDYIVSHKDILDFDQSKILAENTKMKDMITIYAFMKLCIDKDLVNNPTNFDPEDYGTNVEIINTL